MKISEVILTLLLAIAGTAQAQPYDAGDGPSFQLQPAVVVDLSAPSAAAAVGDVNGDGRVDVLAITSELNLAPQPNDNTLFVFLQDETGGLQAPLLLPHHQIWMPLSMAVANLDGQHGSDVAVGGGKGVTRFLSDGIGGLLDGVLDKGEQPHATVMLPIQLGGSGADDLATMTWSSGGHVYRNDGTGELQVDEWDVPAGGYNQIARVDLDDDDRMDVVVSNGQGDPPNVHLFRNGTDGVLAPAGSLSATCAVFGAAGLAAGDVNGDGVDDIVVSSGGNQPDACLIVFYAEAPGTFAAPVSIPVLDIPGAAKVTDFNGDGRNDVIVLHPDAVGIHLQQQDGSLASPVYHPSAPVQHPGMLTIEVADFSGDGCADLAFVDRTNGLVIVKADFCDRLFLGTFDRADPGRSS